jgi:hypothetical protein
MIYFRAYGHDMVIISSLTRWGTCNAGHRAEYQEIASWIAHQEKFENRGKFDIIVMGDFKDPGKNDSHLIELAVKGFQIPDALRNMEFGNQVIMDSNPGKDARFDQIFQLPFKRDRFTNIGGILDFYGSDETIRELFPLERYSPQTFSYQLSDHFPVWMQINVEPARVSGGFLKSIKKSSVKK